MTSQTGPSAVFEVSLGAIASESPKRRLKGFGMGTAAPAMVGIEGPKASVGAALWTADAAAPRLTSGTWLPSRRANFVEDELAGIVSTVCARFPDQERAAVETAVSEAYEHLKANAKVSAHLIPLTLNRSMRLMRESTQRTIEHEDSTGWMPSLLSSVAHQHGNLAVMQQVQAGRAQRDRGDGTTPVIADDDQLRSVAVTQ
jgi:hypothetical protein